MAQAAVLLERERDQLQYIRICKVFKYHRTEMYRHRLELRRFVDPAKRAEHADVVANVEDTRKP